MHCMMRLDGLSWDDYRVVETLLFHAARLVGIVMSLVDTNIVWVAHLERLARMYTREWLIFSAFMLRVDILMYVTCVCVFDDWALATKLLVSSTTRVRNFVCGLYGGYRGTLGHTFTHTWVSWCCTKRLKSAPAYLSNPQTSTIVSLISFFLF